jgi:sporulation protein YlmC with PRC-barrel domain
MSERAEFSIGSEVTCSDGVCGDLRRVVVDPVARALTHLVVEPRHGRGVGHLVPVDLVAATTEGIQLRCTRSEFAALPDAEETRFLPGARGEWAYGQEHLLSWPYFGLHLGAIGAMGGMDPSAGPEVITFDRVPAGEVEVRRGEHVHATDGTVGRVRGLVIDPRDHHMTHVLLDEGHLWGQKRVAIPISAVTGVEDGVRLSLTKHEVRDLPAVDLDQP